MSPVAADARRLVRLYLTADLFAAIFAPGVHAYATSGDDVPGDAEVVEINFCAEHRMMIFTLRSADFPAVPDGTEPPALTVCVRELDLLPLPSEN